MPLGGVCTLSRMSFYSGVFCCSKVTRLWILACSSNKYCTLFGCSYGEREGSDHWCPYFRIHSLLLRPFPRNTPDPNIYAFITEYPFKLLFHQKSAKHKACSFQIW